MADISISRGVKKLVIGEMLPVRSKNQNENLLTKKEYINSLRYVKQIKKKLSSIDIFIRLCLKNKSCTKRK